MNADQLINSRRNRTGERVLHFFKEYFGSFKIIDARYETYHPFEKLYFKEVVIIAYKGHKVRIEWVAQTSIYGSSIMAHWRVMYGFREKMVFGNTILDKYGQRTPDDDNPPSPDVMLDAIKYVTGNHLNNLAGLLGLTRYVLPIVSDFERHDLHSFLSR